LHFSRERNGSLGERLTAFLGPAKGYKVWEESFSGTNTAQNSPKDAKKSREIVHNPQTFHFSAICTIYISQFQNSFLIKFRIFNFWLEFVRIQFKTKIASVIMGVEGGGGNHL